jgi:hypothetical protein
MWSGPSGIASTLRSGDKVVLWCGQRAWHLPQVVTCRVLWAHAAGVAVGDQRDWMAQHPSKNGSRRTHAAVNESVAWMTQVGR